jgi:hypothetical protein
MMARLCIGATGPTNSLFGPRRSHIEGFVDID